MENLEMWRHWCEAENTELSLQTKHPCNWCGKWEDEFEPEINKQKKE